MTIEPPMPLSVRDVPSLAVIVPTTVPAEPMTSPSPPGSCSNGRPGAAGSVVGAGVVGAGRGTVVVVVGAAALRCCGSSPLPPLSR